MGESLGWVDAHGLMQEDGGFAPKGGAHKRWCRTARAFHPTYRPDALAWRTIVTTRSIPSRRLYLQIADQLRTLIYEPGFAVNGRLPPERALAERLGVSRPSIREALVALQLEGRVEIRMGSGVYLCDMPPNPEEAVPDNAEMGDSLIDIMEARAILEGAIAASVAPLAKPKDVRALRTIYQTMERECMAGQIPIAADRAFHVRIAQMSDNEVLVRTVGALYDERQSPMSSRLLGLYEPADTWSVALDEHRQILEAIEARDPIQAQAAMQRHLKASLKRTMARRDHG